MSFEPTPASSSPDSEKTGQIVMTIFVYSMVIMLVLAALWAFLA